MNTFSLIKSRVLRSLDGLNDLVGGPQPFTRAAVPDPSAQFPSDLLRREAIAISAEKELSNFLRSGVFAADLPNDLGDCAIWQGVYAAMTAARWHVSPSPEAQTTMLEAATALSRYFYPVAPWNAALVRGAMPLALEHDLFSIDPANAVQYFSDGTYQYREDASLDSLLGAMFGAAMINRFGDAASRSVLIGRLQGFSRNFTAAGFTLVNRNGLPTTYGDCSPGLLQAPVRILAATLPSLVAGTDDWKAIAEAYGPEFSSTDTQAPGEVAYVNAHLAVLATLTYVCAAPAGAPGLADAKEGLQILMDKYADSGNAFLVLAARALGAPVTTIQLDKANKVLLEFPLGPKPKSGLNSSTAASLQPVPVWQRPPVDIIWQRSPYPYSGSDDHSYSRLDYLLAHYLGRMS